MATHLQQSLPSFAQAFSSPSLNSISTGSKLPPIQTHNPSVHRANSAPRQEPSRLLSPDSHGSTSHSRKRSRMDDNEHGTPADDDSGSDMHSPKLVAVKEEGDHDMLDSSPSPSAVTRSTDTREAQDAIATPTLSITKPTPAAKKRRVTISGTPHPLNTELRVPLPDTTNSTPISPVVMGFTIMRDDPAAIEQVRSVIDVKQKQQALIEQRRGSAVGPASGMGSVGASNGGTSPGPLSAAAREERHPAAKAAPSSRPGRRSPNPSSGSTAPRRGGVAGSASIPPSARPPSPSPIIVPSQAPQGPQSTAPLSALAAPPISFGRRRAGQLGQNRKKPADIVISPREAHTAEQLQPAIQSAPPVPHAGQSQFYPGRFAMMIPRLPPVMGNGGDVRRVAAAQVPPTPTRFTMLRNAAGPSNASATAHLPPPAGATGATRRSPPASVPIATTLVPPTPNTLHHPGYSGDKSAFLAPFELFYDALRDSKQLKNWLGDQLQRSNNLMQSLSQQQERLDEVVESLVEKKTSGLRSEVSTLRQRVDELESALRLAKAEGVARQHNNNSAGEKAKGKVPSRNGVSPLPSEAYAFPPIEPLWMRVEPVGRVSSPGWRVDRDRDSQGGVESEGSSPAPFEPRRRLSVSASRLDAPRPQPDSSPQMRSQFVAQQQSTMIREGSSQNLGPPPPAARVNPSPSSLATTPIRSSFAHSQPEHPPLRRQPSHSRTSFKPEHPGDGSLAEQRPTEGRRSPRQGSTGGNSGSGHSPVTPLDAAMEE